MEELRSVISNKRFDKNYIESIMHRYEKYFSENEELRLKYRETMSELLNLDDSFIKGNNRRKKLYIYLAKKYLPNWTVSEKHGVTKFEAP